MEFIQNYWWLLVVLVALVLAFILLRPRQRVELTPGSFRVLALTALH